jgi:5'-nucleotidase/UDP-sugar diphosphatase
VLGTGDDSGVVRVSGTGPDAVDGDRRIERRVVEPVQEYVEELAETVIGRTEVRLDGTTEVVRTQESNMGNLLADAMVWMGQQRAAEFGVEAPTVGIQNGGGIRNNVVLEAGEEMTLLDTFTIAPFSNFVSVVPDVSPETLKALLERGVSGAPGAQGRFIQASGLSYEYETSRTAQAFDDDTQQIVPPEGERIRTVTLDDGTPIVVNGEIVEGAPLVTLATNDFSARGGDGYPLAGLPFTPVGATYQQALQEYIEVGLSGVVTAAEYPEGGEGRITDVTAQ